MLLRERYTSAWGTMRLGSLLDDHTESESDSDEEGGDDSLADGDSGGDDGGGARG